MLSLFGRREPIEPYVLLLTCSCCVVEGVAHTRACRDNPPRSRRRSTRLWGEGQAALVEAALIV